MQFRGIRRRRLTAPVAAAVCWLLPSYVPAAEVVHELPEYTVWAWHFEKQTLEIPGDVVRIDRAAVERSLAASLPDLLAVEANLHFSTISGFTNVALRGFGEGSGLRSLILVDGQPLNPPDLGRIDWERVPLDSIESVEVLRGGHNVLYGDQALVGVIKIETRRDGTGGLEADGRIGSFDTNRASLAGAFGGADWNVRAGIFREESDGYRDNSASSVRSAYLNAGRCFTGGVEADMRLSVGETDLQYPGALIYDDFRADPRSSSNLGDEGSEDRYANLALRVRGERDWGSWEVLGGGEYSDLDFTFGAGSFGTNEQTGFSLKPRARLDGDGMAVIVGFDASFNALDFTEYLDASRRLVPGEAEISESRVSPYFLVERTVLEDVTLSAGLRHEWVRYEVDYTAYDPDQLRPVFETNQGVFPNPDFMDPPDVLSDASFDEVIRQDGTAAEFSVNWRIVEDWSLWAGYDRVYRHPVFDERASYQGFELAENVTADLEAEKGDNFEAGVKFIRGGHELFVTAFLLLMKNEIVFDPDLRGGNPKGNGLNINLGPVDRFGGDLAYAYDGRTWGFSARLAVVQTEIRSGEGKGQEVPLVPEMNTVGQVWWRPVDALRLRVVHRYVGRQYQGGDFTNSLREIDDYHLFDFDADLQVSPQCRIFLALANAFDERYAEGAYEGVYYPGDGRSLTAGVKLNF